MKFIVCSTLLISALYIIFSVGRMIVESSPEITLGQIFLLIIISVVFTFCYLGIRDINNKTELIQYSSSLDEPIDKIFEKDKRKLKLFKYKNGKFIWIGHVRPRIPYTVNTCPKEWIPNLKKINGPIEDDSNKNN